MATVLKKSIDTSKTEHQSRPPNNIATVHKAPPSVVNSLASEKRYDEWMSRLDHFEFILAKQLDSECGEDSVLELLDELIGKTVDDAMERHLKLITFPFAVDKVLSDVMEVLKWACIVHDPGEEDPIHDPSWLLDEEPARVPCDSWARGIIPIRAINTDKEVYAASQRNRVIGLRTSGGSVIQHTNQRESVTDSVSTASGITATKSNKASKPTGSVVQPRPVRTPVKKASVIKKGESLVGVSDETQKAYKNELVVPVSAVKKPQSNGDDKQTFIVSSQINPESLPPQFVQVKVDVRDKLGAEEPKKARANPYGANPKRQRAQGAGGAGGMLQAKKQGSDGFRELPTEEANGGCGIGQIQLVAGVTLKDEKGQRSGPAISTDPSRMTRKEYTRLMSLPSQINTAKGKA